MATVNAVQSVFRTVLIGTVDTITFSGYGAQFRILNRGLTDLWVRVDGTNPAVSTDESHLVRTEEVRFITDPSGDREIRVTGTLACLYAVELVA